MANGKKKNKFNLFTMIKLYKFALFLQSNNTEGHAITSTSNRCFFFYNTEIVAFPHIVSDHFDKQKGKLDDACATTQQNVVKNYLLHPICV